MRSVYHRRPGPEDEFLLRPRLGQPHEEQRQPAEHPQRLQGDAEPEQREEVRQQTQRVQCHQVRITALLPLKLTVMFIYCSCIFCRDQDKPEDSTDSTLLQVNN